MKQLPKQFKGLPFYTHPVVSRTLIVMFVLATVGTFIFYGLPTDFPQNVKLILFLIVFGAFPGWILRIPLNVYKKWEEANKAERAKSEALFLQQQKEEQRVSGT